MRWENDQRTALRVRGADLTRQEELKLQEEFIATNGVRKLPAISNEADYERWQRIADFRRELKEKYRKQPELN